MKNPFWTVCRSLTGQTRHKRTLFMALLLPHIIHISPKAKAPQGALAAAVCKEGFPSLQNHSHCLSRIGDQLYAN